MDVEHSKREAKRLGNALANMRVEIRQLRAVVTELQRDVDDVSSQQPSHYESSETWRGVSKALNDDESVFDISECEDFDDAVDEDDAVEHSSVGKIGSSTLCDASMIGMGTWGNVASYEGVGLASALRNEAKDVGGSNKRGKEYCSGEHSCIEHNCGAQVAKKKTPNNRSAICVGVVGRFFVAAFDSDLHSWRGGSEACSRTSADEVL